MALTDYIVNKPILKTERLTLRQLNKGFADIDPFSWLFCLR